MDGKVRMDPGQILQQAFLGLIVIGTVNIFGVPSDPVPIYTVMNIKDLCSVSGSLHPRFCVYVELTLWNGEVSEKSGTVSCPQGCQHPTTKNLEIIVVSLLSCTL